MSLNSNFFFYVFCTSLSDPSSCCVQVAPEIGVSFSQLLSVLQLTNTFLLKENVCNRNREILAKEQAILDEKQL